MSSIPSVVLLMSHGHGYERGILRGIARYARHHGPWKFFLAENPSELSLPTRYTVTLRPGRFGRLSVADRISSPLDLRTVGATGVIGRINTPRIVAAVMASKRPVIAMDLTDQQLSEKSPLRRVSEIRPDSHKAGILAAEHLLDRGFRNFAFCGYPGENWSRRRQESFVERLQEAGHACDVFPSPPQKSRIPWHQQQPAVAAWLASLPKPAGVLACNDVRGRQMLEACAIEGIHVPDDIAVVGVDDDHVLSDLSNPPLSSVTFDAEQGGYRAAELLHGMMSGQVRRRQLILVDALWVVARSSTDILALDDRDVAKAIMYIRDNARRPIDVTEVVNHLAISRRALEVRFQRHLERSIREEIQRVRVNWAKQLLIETDLPTQKIAKCTGFNTPSYLSKVFRRATGATLAEYRRAHRSS